VLDIYRLENGAYPTAEQGLQALVTAPAGSKTWNGPYLDKASALSDPWNNPYRYRVPGERSKRGYDLFSYGADNAEGGEGENRDIWS
jgi:general secretion pathway protein G